MTKVEKASRKRMDNRLRRKSKQVPAVYYVIDLETQGRIPKENRARRRHLNAVQRRKSGL